MKAANIPPGYRPVGHAGLVAPLDVKAAQFGLYNTPRSTGQLDFYRPRWFATGDIRKLVTEYDRWELMNFARQLFAGLGNVSAAILQKAHRAVGESWRAQYCGSADRAWGDEVEEWLEHVFYPNCDMRGTPYDFITNLILSSIALHVDGDDAMILTEDPDTHFPKLQFIPAHRINTRMRQAASSDRITSGWADGGMVSQGIIYDTNQNVIGIRVLGDGDGQDRDVPMTSAQLLYDPVWQSQNRGIPPISVEIMSGMDYQDIDTFIKRGIKKATSIGVIRETESGQADTGEGFIADTPLQDFSPGIKREMTRGGEDYYFTAGKGEKMKSIDWTMPSQVIEEYIHRMEHRVILAAGWHQELLDPSRLRGATVRLIQDNARASVRHLQKSLRVRALRAVRYAVAKAMKNGWISRNDVDWWKWDFEMPALITVDQGHDATADFKMLALGAMTEAKYHAKFGDSSKQVGLQKQAEVLDRIRRAEEIAGETGKDFDWVYSQIWNPAAAPQNDGSEGANAATEEHMEDLGGGGGQPGGTTQ